MKEDIYGYEERTYAYATEDLLSLLHNDVDHMKGVVTIYGNIEKIMNDQHMDQSENVWSDSCVAAIVNSYDDSSSKSEP